MDASACSKARRVPSSSRHSSLANKVSISENFASSSSPTSPSSRMAIHSSSSRFSVESHETGARQLCCFWLKRSPFSLFLLFRMVAFRIEHSQFPPKRFQTCGGPVSELGRTDWARSFSAAALILLLGIKSEGIFNGEQEPSKDGCSAETSRSPPDTYQGRGVRVESAIDLGADHLHVSDSTWPVDGVQSNCCSGPAFERATERGGFPDWDRRSPASARGHFGQPRLDGLCLVVGDGLNKLQNSLGLCNRSDAFCGRRRAFSVGDSSSPTDCLLGGRFDDRQPLPQSTLQVRAGNR